MLESAAVSYGKATPHFPVIALLRCYAHVEERDDLRTVRAKVTEQVLTLDETLQGLCTKRATCTQTGESAQKALLFVDRKIL
jgi:hypothetical protein